MFPLVKRQLSVSQKMFLVIGTHLTGALLWKHGVPENDSPYCPLSRAAVEKGLTLRERKAIYLGLTNKKKKI